MKRLIKFFPFSFIIILSSASCTGSKPVIEQESEAAIVNEQPVRIDLSPETTELLIQEMHELQKGMKKIVPALVAGKWKEISYIGNKMQNSYIMKESLTKAQMHELHENLPETFQKLDRDFHNAAGLLEEAAKKQNREQISYYYYKMTEACVECHSLYATHKFPEFLKSKDSPKKQ